MGEHARRGKQFNSITFEGADLITGATSRKAVFFSPEDARRLGLARGSPVRASRTTTRSSEVEPAPLR